MFSHITDSILFVLVIVIAIGSIWKDNQTRTQQKNEMELLGYEPARKIDAFGNTIIGFQNKTGEWETDVDGVKEHHPELFFKKPDAQ